MIIIDIYKIIMATAKLIQAMSSSCRKSYTPFRVIKGAGRRIKSAAQVILTGNRPYFAAPPPTPTQPLMPQAIVEDSSLQSHENKDWRNYFSSKLNGKGLEIGPLHRPLPTHKGMQVDYIDRYPIAQLKSHYPEIQDQIFIDPQIIGDAETLSSVPEKSYDFLVSAHVIEHMKNPIGSIEHWCRVLKPGGLLYLIVPDKRMIFDKMRVRTTLEHLILDYKRPSDERDFEHCLEYGLFVHDKHGLDALYEADNIVNTAYSIHYHTFIPTDVKNIINWISANVRPLEIVEGPCMAPGDHEFHFLLKA